MRMSDNFGNNNNMMMMNNTGKIFIKSKMEIIIIKTMNTNTKMTIIMKSISKIILNTKKKMEKNIMRKNKSQLIKDILMKNNITMKTKKDMRKAKDTKTIMDTKAIMATKKRIMATETNMSINIITLSTMDMTNTTKMITELIY